MKMIIIIIITALLSWIGCYFLPWWMIAAVPFIVMLSVGVKPAKGFLLGMLSIALLWLYLILKADIANEHILSDRMAKLIGLSHVLLIVVNIILGALVGGLGGWCGALFHNALKSKR